MALVSDVETTRGLWIPRGSIGTVAEDRGSRLVVFFDGDTDEVASLDGQELRSLGQ